MSITHSFVSGIPDGSNGNLVKPSNWNAAHTIDVSTTFTTPVIASFYQDAGLTKLMTTPNVASDTLVTLAAAQTLTSKTLTSPTINGTIATTGLTLPAVTLSGAVAGGAQTISNANVTVGASRTLDVSAGTLTLADNQISGDKVEGGTIAATTITTLSTTTINAHALGGNMTVGEYAIVLDASLSGDETWSGITELGTMGYAATVGDLMYLAVADTKWEKAKADAAATSKGKIGLCTATTAENSTCQVLLYGKLRSAAFPALTVGAPVHISEATAGAIQVAAPTGTTNFVVRIIGYGNTAEDLFFCPDNTYVELA